MTMQPYQIFFPVGILYAIYGALLWLFFQLGWISYPGQLHAHMMVSGFLFSFALGFLMTAVPRFTGASPAKKWEVHVALLLAVSSFFGQYLDAISLLVLLFIAVFFFLRIREKTHTPPPHFILIPIGLGFGILGSVLSLFDSPVGRVFLYQGTMLCFVLGVGGKLVRALLGWSDSPLVQISRFSSKKKQVAIPSSIILTSILIVVGFMLELTSWAIFGRILRAVAASAVALVSWKIYRKPKLRGRLTNWLWISCMGLIFGLWLYALVPSLGVHALHLMFIGGFGLMTLVIASRVTLAHGGYDLEIELSSGGIRWAGAFVLLASLTRVSAPLTPSYIHHLGYAASAWVVAILIWSSAFVPRILKSADSLEKTGAT
jgi:uncharacterized protein involved in response to NO